MVSAQEGAAMVVVKMRLNYQLKVRTVPCLVHDTLRWVLPVLRRKEKPAGRETEL